MGKKAKEKKSKTGAQKKKNRQKAQGQSFVDQPANQRRQLKRKLDAACL